MVLRGMDLLLECIASGVYVHLAPHFQPPSGGWDGSLSMFSSCLCGGHTISVAKVGTNSEQSLTDCSHSICVVILPSLFRKRRKGDGQASHVCFKISAKSLELSGTLHPPLNGKDQLLVDMYPPFRTPVVPGSLEGKGHV